MLFFENIYFLILFTLPAAANIIFNAKIRRVPITQRDKSVELAENVLFCMVVLGANVFFMRIDILKFIKYLLVDESTKKIVSITEKFDFLDFMFHYFWMNLISTVLVILLWYWPGQWAWRNISNYWNKKEKRSKELKYADVWRNVFETKEFIDTESCVVKIERDGTLITAGHLVCFPSPTQDKKELALCNTESIMEIFEEDKEKDPSDRVFLCSEVEYYDIETGTSIKFYKTDKYDAEYEKEPE